MAFNGPVLLKRIPDEASQRKLIRYDDYVASGGYKAYHQALGMKPVSATK